MSVINCICDAVIYFQFALLSKQTLRPYVRLFSHKPKPHIDLIALIYYATIVRLINDSFDSFWLIQVFQWFICQTKFQTNSSDAPSTPDVSGLLWIFRKFCWVSINQNGQVLFLNIFVLWSQSTVGQLCRQSLSTEKQSQTDVVWKDKHCFCWLFVSMYSKDITTLSTCIFAGFDWKDW